MRIKMIQLKLKNGVSVMIGYILLVVFVIIISAVVYQWLRSYVPSEPFQCSEEISLFIKEATFNSSKLNLTIKNNGKFNVAGYFIHAKNDSSRELPTINLANHLDSSSYYGRPAVNLSDFVLFIGLAGEKENPFAPGEQATHIFNIPASIGNITTIRIIPTIFKKEENRNRFLSCGDSRTEGLVGKLFVCTDICFDLNYECGTKTICGIITNCGVCSENNACNGTGRCVALEQCTDTCSSLGKECNSWEICGVSTNCGTCTSGNSCNSTGQCITTPASCGDGNLDVGEKCDNGNGNTNTQCTPPYGGTCNYCSLSCESITLAGARCGDGVVNIVNNENCDDGNTLSGDGCSSSCLTESEWECLGQPSTCTITVNSCPSYCVSLGYNGGACRSSPGNCVSNNGFYESGGDIWCNGGPNANTCCCNNLA